MLDGFDALGGVTLSIERTMKSVCLPLLEVDWKGRQMPSTRALRTTALLQTDASQKAIPLLMMVSFSLLVDMGVASTSKNEN